MHSIYEWLFISIYSIAKSDTRSVAIGVDSSATSWVYSIFSAVNRNWDCCCIWDSLHKAIPGKSQVNLQLSLYRCFNQQVSLNRSAKLTSKSLYHYNSWHIIHTYNFAAYIIDVYPVPYWLKVGVWSMLIATDFHCIHIVKGNSPATLYSTANFVI